MLRSQNAERHAKDGVDPSGEDIEMQRPLEARFLRVKIIGFLFACSRDRKGKLAPFAASDPVSLHRFDSVGPIDGVETIDQLLGIVGDLEVPLGDPFLFDDCSGALCASRDNFFVSENGLVDWVPVHCTEFSEGESAVIENLKDPLGPLVVAGVRALEGARPVETDADKVHLPLVVGGVVLDHRSRVALALDRFVLGWKSEGVEAHRVQNIVTLHEFHSAGDIGGNVVSRVSDAETCTAWIGEKFEAVKLWTALILAGLK